MLNIVFMGTPDFAKESLEKIYNAGYNIIAVVTNPDKPKGRGMKMLASPVKEFAIEKGIQIFQPNKIREIEEELKKLKPDLFCVVAYGKILPKDILDIPQLGSINVHGSLLPKYRGAAPIQWAVINGDKITGITTMYMDEGMDTGDMILKQEVEIGENETTGELWNRLSTIGAELLVETLNKIENGTISREKQPEGATMAPMLNKEMSKIDWNTKTVAEIKNLVRGLNPIMGAYSILQDKKLKIWKVEKQTTKEFEKENNQKIEDVENGTIIKVDNKKGVYVKAKDGLLLIQEVQAENSRKMNIQDFLRGNPLKMGEVFE